MLVEIFIGKLLFCRDIIYFVLMWCLWLFMWFEIWVEWILDIWFIVVVVVVILCRLVLGNLMFLKFLGYFLVMKVVVMLFDINFGWFIMVVINGRLCLMFLILKLLSVMCIVLIVVLWVGVYV